MEGLTMGDFRTGVGVALAVLAAHDVLCVSCKALAEEPRPAVSRTIPGAPGRPGLDDKRVRVASVESQHPSQKANAGRKAPKQGDGEKLTDDRILSMLSPDAGLGLLPTMRAMCVPEAIPGLSRILRDRRRDKRTRKRASVLLSWIGSSAARKPLVDVLETEYPAASSFKRGPWRYLLHAMDTHSRKGSEKQLREDLRHRSRHVRYSAVRELVRRKSVAAIPELSHLQRDEHPHLRSMATWAPKAIREANPLPFRKRPPVSLTQAVQPIQPEKMGLRWGQWGPPGLLRMMWAKKMGMGEKDEPTVLATLHRDFHGGTAVLRYYRVDGQRFHPQVQLLCSAGVFELRPIRFIRHNRTEEFIIVWFHWTGSAGGGWFAVLWINGSEVRDIPIEDPIKKIEHVFVRRHQHVQSSWYLEDAKACLSEGSSPSLWGGQHFGNVRGLGFSF